MLASNEAGTTGASSALQEVPGTQIRPAQSATPPPRADVIAGGESVRPYINDQLNSRLPQPLAGSPWIVRWQSNLDPEFPFSFVLAAGNRILLQGPGRWQLFDAEGKSLRQGKLGAGDVVMDDANGVFYLIDPFGVLAAHRLTDGELEYSVSISGGEEWQRSFYARRSQEFAVASFQREIQPHGAVTPTAVTIDVEDLGNPLQIEQQTVVSSKQESRLYYEVPRVSAALLGQTLVAAISNELLVTAFGKSIRTRLLGTFAAGPLSLDEAGRIYLLAGHDNRVSLWVLTASGERAFAFDFPADIPVRPMPPVVGYSHQTYFTTGESVLCLSAEGKLQWRKTAGAAVVGLAAAPSDEVVVSAGSDLAAFDSQGERRVIHTFKGDVLKTPPAMTRDGDLLVASARHLYRLTASRHH